MFQEIINLLDKNEKNYADLVSSVGQEIKGIINSEMIIFMALCDALRVNKIIESGRARGQSTEVICKYIENLNPTATFESIEFDDKSVDVPIAIKRLQKYADTVKLTYGDSMTLLPKIVEAGTSNDNFAILIDGPKGYNAILLACELLRSEKIKFVAIHDMDKGKKDLRSSLEIWPEFLATDDILLVDRLKEYDLECWKIYEQLGMPQAPYLAMGTPTASYGPTLAFLFKVNDEKTRFNSIKNLHKITKRLQLREKISHKVLKFIPSKLKQILKKFLKKT